MKIALCATVIVASLSFAEAASACSVPWFRTFHNQTVDGQMTVRSGRRCNIIFWSSGPTETTAIVRKPSHGHLQFGEVGKLVYQSRAGYVGADEFTYVRRGKDMSDNPSVRTVRIVVTVTP
jgi:hypothetical protein